MREVEAYLSAKSHQKPHPLFLPTMLLNFLNTFYISHRKKLEESLYLEESGVGITRGNRKTDAWKWSYERQKNATKRFHGLNTNLVYLERRLVFARGLGEFIVRCLAACEEEDVFPSSGEERKKLLRISKEFRECVENDGNFVECQLSQVLSLQKRVQALVSVVSELSD